MRGERHRPYITGSWKLFFLIPISIVEVKKANLFEGCTFLVEVKGGGRGIQAIVYQKSS